MRSVLLIMILAIAPFFVACASNGFKDFYVDKTNGIDVEKSPRVIHTSAEANVIAGQDPTEDGRRMSENGYVLIGYSSFNGASIASNDVMAQAKRVHAQVVIFYKNYSGTVSGSMPLMTPTTQTTQTSFSGSYGSTPFYGSGTSTTYGTNTTYIPYSIARYDFFATYWVKVKPPIFGGGFSDLTDSKRKEIGSNKGVQITYIVKDSPAYNVDLLRDDVIRKYGGQEVIDAAQFLRLIPNGAGKTIEIEIVRDGKPITKIIKIGTLNDQPAPVSSISVGFFNK